MEITSRQFGQIEAACFALEEATEKNNTALRLVKVIKDNLADIAKTAYPLELVFEFDQPELPMDNSKHQKICSLLKKWLRNHGITQEVLATRYKVSQSVISRQLSGKESIPEERIQDIINLTNPPDAEIELMNTLLTGESSSASIVSDKNKLSRTMVESDPSDQLATAEQSEDGSDKLSEIRLYGQELINQGATMKELIKMVMEHFALTQDAFAHLIKVNQGSLSKYLRNGERKDAVITGVTEFFGENGGALKEDK